MFKEYNKVIIFDTETTGTKFEKDQIIEIAALVLEKRNGGLIATKKYDKFIKLHAMDELPENITELTHITNETLQEYGNDEKKVAEEIKELFTGHKTLLVAHNAQFDINMLYYMFKRAFGYEKTITIMESYDYLDTQTVFKDRKEFPHRLETAIEYYKLTDKCQNSHRAIDDVMALAYVTNALAMERDDLDAYINVFGYNPKYKIDGLTFHFIKYKKQFLNKTIVTEDKILPYLN